LYSLFRGSVYVYSADSYSTLTVQLTWGDLSLGSVVVSRLHHYLDGFPSLVLTPYCVLL